MDKDALIQMVNSGSSQREIAVLLNTSQGNVRHWLRKFDLSTKLAPCNKKHNVVEKYCKRCETMKPIEDFYDRSKSRDTKSGYCKACSNNYHTNRVKNVKIRMIEYKGGKCEMCDLSLTDTHYSVFDFHHTDPMQKDPNFDRIKYQKWSVIQAELDKCILLCSNHHRIIEAQIHNW